MSGNLVGAEAGQMQALSSKFSTEAEQLTQIAAAIDSQVASTSEWKGAARDRFDAEWPEYKSSLTKLSQLLTECSQEVARRGEAIIQAGS
jgi:WXG100 family type VII secretion target